MAKGAPAADWQPRHLLGHKLHQQGGEDKARHRNADDGENHGDVIGHFVLVQRGNASQGRAQNNGDNKGLQTDLRRHGGAALDHLIDGFGLGLHGFTEVAFHNIL